jgi:hypothetical protein
MTDVGCSESVVDDAATSRLAGHYATVIATWMLPRVALE